MLKTFFRKLFKPHTQYIHFQLASGQMIVLEKSK